MKLLFISLGCDKNLVDSEVMLGELSKRGYSFTEDETEADIIVKQEELEEAKKEEVKAEAPKVEAKKEPKQDAPKEETPAEAKAEITYDDFAKLDLRVVEVLECSKVEKADKLLQFKLKMGDEIRTVVSGIAKFYKSPEELVGKKLVLVANLAPKKIRGIVSHGMLLSAATDDDSLLQVLQVTHEDIPSGATVC